MDVIEIENIIKIIPITPSNSKDILWNVSSWYIIDKLIFVL